MKSFVSKRYIALTTILVLLPVIVQSELNETGLMFKVSLQKRIASEPDPGAFIIVNEIQEWNGKETAIIICDMWDRHWCSGATQRVAEMAPAMNEVVSIARNNGVQIVHAPSDCMGFYKDYPARKLAKKYNSKSVAEKLGEGKLECELDHDWPFEISHGGCDDTPKCKMGNPWTKQIDDIKIKEGDIISDSGIEAGSFFVKNGIKNVILVGVHTNMCVIGRSFGLRNMVRLGMNVALMRDMTDTMYDSTSSPFVSHFTGNSLMHAYIEKNVCPTMVSSDFTQQKQFRFQKDKRKVIAFIIAEGEYRANQRLPEFAHELLLTKNVNCEFALGKPVMEGDGRHNIENLQIMNDADLAVFFARRRALEAEKMALTQNYVYSGKPVLGIRTASHAFDTRRKIVNNKESDTFDDGDKYLASWPEFDKDILGGNYTGHYGHLKQGTTVSIVPGMQDHPLLQGVDPEGFISYSTLYKNNPLRSDNAQVILTGKIPDHPSEPLLWINQNQYGKAIYTSLGHWDDWKIESFKKIILNSIDYLLKQKIN